VSSKLFFALSAGVLLLTSSTPMWASAPAIPEPSTLVLMGGGIGALILVRQIKNRKK